MFTVLEIDIGSFCTGASQILQLIGWILTIFKIAIPLLVIAFGIFDFGKAVTAADDKEIKKSVKSLMWRAIAGVVIFFIPTIVMGLFNAVTTWSTMEGSANFGTCRSCVLSPWSADCAEAVRNAENIDRTNG